MRLYNMFLNSTNLVKYIKRFSHLIFLRISNFSSCHQLFKFAGSYILIRHTCLKYWSTNKIFLMWFHLICSRLLAINTIARYSNIYSIFTALLKCPSFLHVPLTH